MKACAEYQEIIWMDLYEELKPNLRSRLRRHLAACPACRLERSRMDRVLDAAREGAPGTELAPAAAEAMARSITETLRENGSRHGWRQRLGLGSKMSFSALTATGLALLLLVWGGMRIDFGGSPVSTDIRLSRTEQTLLQEDYEVIRHLDLLEEMDTVEKLVQVVDKREYDYLEDTEDPHRRGAAREYRMKRIEV